MLIDVSNFEFLKVATEGFAERVLADLLEVLYQIQALDMGSGGLFGLGLEFNRDVVVLHGDHDVATARKPPEQ